MNGTRVLQLEAARPSGAAGTGTLQLSAKTCVATNVILLTVGTNGAVTELQSNNSVSGAVSVTVAPFTTTLSVPPMPSVTDDRSKTASELCGSSWHVMLAPPAAPMFVF